MREGDGWKAVELDEVGPLPWAGAQVRWHPLRETLGTRIVGIAAFTAARAFVLVSDTHVHRNAIAEEPGTAVLALGGPPTFEPSASEWIERARAHLRSDPQRARAILDDLGTIKPDSVGVAIGEALWEAAQGNPKTAHDYLETALSADPSVRAALLADPDLGPLLKGPR